MTQPWRGSREGRKRRALVARGAPVPRAATLSNCGEFLKPPATAAPPKGVAQHQGNDLGDGNSAEDVTMDDPQPSAKGRHGLRVLFND